MKRVYLDMDNVLVESKGAFSGSQKESLNLQF
jgi:hypothetical protein